jgi:K+/H+ antiporter YhaU regulatory subunit KhtT
VALDPELRVVKVSARGVEHLHPADAAIREKTGCSVVAVERGEDLLVEFPNTFRVVGGDAIYICGSAEATQRYAAVFPQE